MDWLDVFVEEAEEGDVEALVVNGTEAVKVPLATLDPTVLEAMEKYDEIDQEIKALEEQKKELRETVESYGVGAVALSSGRIIAVGQREAWDTTAKVRPKIVKQLVEMGKYDQVAELGLNTKKLNALAAEDPSVKALLTKKVSTVVTFKKVK